MNNDPTPSTAAADLPPNPLNSNLNLNPENELEPELELPAGGSSSDPTAAPSQNVRRQTPAQKRATAAAKKRHEFIKSAIAQFDKLVYMELCYVYYMDCSFFRLFIRAFAQLLFLTPKPSKLPHNRPYLQVIIGTNILCILLHLFTARSEGSEAMRGYLHGGIIIDLIGQKGPTSKIHLLLLDIVVVILQSVMVAVTLEWERLGDVLKESLNPTTGDRPRVEVAVSQDHDAEERGIMRDSATATGDIEMQTLNPGPSQNQDAEANEERERLLAEPPSRENSEDENPLDIFWAGTANLADFYVLDALRSQVGAEATASGSPFSAEFAAVRRSQRLNAVSRRLQRSVEALSA